MHVHNKYHNEYSGNSIIKRWYWPLNARRKLLFYFNYFNFYYRDVIIGFLLYVFKNLKTKDKNCFCCGKRNLNWFLEVPFHKVLWNIFLIKCNKKTIWNYIGVKLIARLW